MNAKTPISENINRAQDFVDGLLQQGGTTHGLRRALRRLSKELGLFKNHQAGVANALNATAGLGFSKVQIGGGSHVLPGFLNIDIVPPADVVCDVREGIPLGGSSCDFVFTEHFFEHIDYPISAKMFVSECHRILRDGGKVVLGVPDSEMAAQAYCKRDQTYFDDALKRWYSNRDCLKDINTPIDLLNYHFRDQDDDDKYNPHFWAYDFEKLKSLFSNAGFRTVEPWKFDSSIANPKREFGSIYIEAIK
jgi:predicted SAM-dependent methyltransferase